MGTKSSKESTKATTSSKGEDERELKVKKFKRERAKSAIRFLDPVSGIETYVPKLERIENSTIIGRREPKRIKIPKSISEDLIVVRTDSDAVFLSYHNRPGSSGLVALEQDDNMRSSSSSSLSFVPELSRSRHQLVAFKAMI